MLVYIIHDVVTVLSEMLCVYVRKLGGERRIGKGEEISFVWREGERWWGRGSEGKGEF